ncbi:MAG: hypothetical protein K5886_12055 [Lachnospiraceae bacterium]|nr:hypothetical protein [Lachnospiraceae bacterium]
MNEKRYVVGYDLNDTVTQISYSELNREAPMSVAKEGSERKLGIPTVVCKRKGVSQWYYGNDAEEVAKKGSGMLATKLLGVARAGGKYEVEGQAYDASDLLVLFVRRTLTELSLSADPEQIVSLVITVDVLDEKTIELLDKVASALPLNRDRIRYNTYADSIYQYMIHQPEELWEKDVFVFDYSGKGLHGQDFRINKNTTPKVGLMEEFEFEEIRMPDIMLGSSPKPEDIEEFDEDVLVKIHGFFVGKSISTVYLLGEGFDPGYLNKTVKYMCMGRRVFQGKNLYAKGACFFARDRAVNSSYLSDFVFLGKDKLKFNLGIIMERNGNEEYIAVADGGENWFEAGKTIEMLLREGNEIMMIITPLNGKDKKNLRMVLDGLPERPMKATRIRLRIEFSSETALKATAWDMGFGDIFPSSGLKWEETLDIESNDTLKGK